MLAATANVVMQMSRPEVGRGVLESTVESGQLTRHPLKRFRTTFSYLAVALLGTERERDMYRVAVDEVHARVRSGPQSPVRYNAFDPDLQLWVAACLYRGAVDVRERLRGPAPESEADWFYSEAARLATTLQVRPEQWPADRQRFDRYWRREMATLEIDQQVRRYLLELIDLGFLPTLLRVSAGPANRFLTAGFLPPEFRDVLRIRWTDADERRFSAAMRSVGALTGILPTALRTFPLDACLLDLRLRAMTGRNLV